MTMLTQLVISGFGVCLFYWKFHSLRFACGLKISTSLKELGGKTHNNYLLTAICRPHSTYSVWFTDRCAVKGSVAMATSNY